MRSISAIITGLADGSDREKYFKALQELTVCIPESKADVLGLLDQAAIAARKRKHSDPLGVSIALARAAVVDDAADDMVGSDIIDAIVIARDQGDVLTEILLGRILWRYFDNDLLMTQHSLDWSELFPEFFA